MLKNKFAVLFTLLSITIGQHARAENASAEFRAWRNLNGVDFETAEGGAKCSSGEFVFNEDDGVIMIRLGPTIQFQYDTVKRNAVKTVERGDATRCRYETNLVLTETALNQETKAIGCLNPRDNSVTKQELRILGDDRLSYSSVVITHDGKKKEVRCVFKKED